MIHTKTTYLFDENGYYMGEGSAFDTELTPNEYYYNENTATLVKPPNEREGFIRIFNKSSQKWKEKENHIGKTVYRCSDKEKHVIEDVGPIPSGYTTDVPEDLSVWDYDNEEWLFDTAAYIHKKKKDFVKELEEYRWKLNYEETMFLGDIEIYCSTDSRSRLDFSSNSVKVRGFKKDETFVFKTVTGEFVDIKIEDFLKWPVMLLETEQECFVIEYEVTEMISALATKEEIDSFNVIEIFDNKIKEKLNGDVLKYSIPKKYKKENTNVEEKSKGK